MICIFPYILVNSQSILLPSLFLGVIELALLLLAAWVAQQWQSSLTEQVPLWGAMAQQPCPHLSFAFVLSCCSLSMGVYPAMVREGYASMVLRTLVSFFLLGIVALYGISM